MYSPSSSGFPLATGVDSSSSSPLERRLLGSTLLQRSSTDPSWLVPVADLESATKRENSPELVEDSQEIKYGFAPARSFVRPHFSAATSSSSNRFEDTFGPTPQLQPRKLERVNSKTEAEPVRQLTPAVATPPTPMYASRTFERRPIPKGCWSEYSSFLKMCTLLTLTILGTIIYIVYITTRPEMPRYELRDINFSHFVLHESNNRTKGALPLGEQRAVIPKRQLEFALSDLYILAMNPSRRGQIQYHNSTIHVRYQEAELGNGTFYGFVQKAKHASLVYLSVPATVVELDNSLWRQITSDISSSVMRINVEGSVKVDLSLFGLALSSPISRISCYMDVIPSNYTTASIVAKACS